MDHWVNHLESKALEYPPGDVEIHSQDSCSLHYYGESTKNREQRDP